VTSINELPPRHQLALRWFEGAAGSVIGWPPPLSDGTLVATRAKGIYKPAWSHAALSVRRMLDGPYPDSPIERLDDRWFLDYRPERGDDTFTNRGLRYAASNGIPIGVLEQVSTNPPGYKIWGLGQILDDSGESFTIAGPSLEGGPGVAGGSNSVDALLSALASTDRPSAGASRVEQRLLRKALMRGQESAQCSLCASTLPGSLLVAAHVKPRRLCSDSERRDAGVVMLACRLGCDALFEDGYVWVDRHGIIRSGTRLDDLGLDSVMDRIVGRRCLASGPRSGAYFAWHQRHVARAG
jgi:hypothetical protein